MIPIQIKAIVVGVAIMVTFSVGWTTRGWYEASQQEAANKAKAKAEAAQMQRESDIAKVVEEQLTRVNESRGVVYREVTKVIRQPVYDSDCIDADGLRLINQAAGHPAKLDGKVPAAPATARKKGQ